ncbi:MAG: hypothetical protein GPJ54_01760 [Candidatus Heimdallarchaeota archaeon]|nr:hypothetical protein [Candidatus Heimdallarchaeota archaeon]
MTKEFGVDIINRNYRPHCHKKKIVMDYANIDEQFKINSLETADISY